MKTVYLYSRRTENPYSTSKHLDWSEQRHLAGDVGELLARAADDLRRIGVKVVGLEVGEDLVGTSPFFRWRRQARRQASAPPLSGG